jgi:hypothetical protein
MPASSGVYIFTPNDGVERMLTATATARHPIATA